MKCGYFHISFPEPKISRCETGKEALYFDCGLVDILVCEDHKCRHNRKATEAELKAYQEHLENK